MLPMGRWSSLALLLLPLVGCKTNSWTVEPLTPLVGRWVGTAETTFPEGGERVKVRATTIAGWARADEVLVERTVTKVPGQPSWSSVTVWVRAEDLGGWKTYSINTAGLEETGFASYDEQADLWRLEARSVNRETRARTTGAGTIRFERADEREHDWIVRDAGGAQLFRIRGSYQRVRGELPPPKTELPRITTPRRSAPESAPPPEKP